MTTITIPARDVQTGDVIPSLGLRVALNADSYSGKRVLYFGPDDPTETTGSVHLDPDALVTVDRADPDAELIERMARAIHGADYVSSDWGSYPEEERDAYLEMARAALAVVRADQ